MSRLHANLAFIPALPPLLAFLLAACSQEPYLLDAEALSALDGALPDSDPGLLAELDEPGHEHQKPSAADEAALDDGAPLVADEVEPSSMREQEREQLGQALLFPGSPMSLEDDPMGWPQRTTVQLTVTWKNGEIKPCSGTLIRPDAVLTAAHCLYNASRGGFASSIAASPGMQGATQAGVGQIWAKRSLVPGRYRELEPSRAKAAFDYGVVRLKQGFSVGTRTLALGSKALGRAFTVRGYPGDGSDVYDGRHMYRSSDRIRSIRTDGLFRHHASTLGGTSGAGIDDGTRVIGVHITGDAHYNEGVVFSPTSLQVVEDFATRAL